MIPASEDFDFIRKRLTEIKTEETPLCSHNATHITLYNCLRSSARCPEICPNYHDWIGPE